MQVIPDQYVASTPARLDRSISMIVLVLLVVACFAVLRPFLSALLWSVILSFALWPAHRQLLAWLRWRRTLAALVTTLVILAALVIPLIVTVANLAEDARDLGVVGRTWLQSGVPSSPGWVRSVPGIGLVASRWWDEFASGLNDFTRDVTSGEADASGPEPVDQSKLRQAVRTLIFSARTWLIAFGLAIGHGIFQVVLALFLMFFILRDGEALAQRLRNMALRISGERGGRLLNVAAGTVRGVLYGILGTAAVQGLMAGIGFVIAGVPGATLLGLLTFFLSVLPMGPPLVWIPASIWLFHSGSAGWGVFMLLWGIGVSSIDNVVKPWIISRGSKMPFLLIFLGALGGALLFGLIGVFIGPTLLAVVYRIIEEWSVTAVTVHEDRSSSCRIDVSSV